VPPLPAAAVAAAVAGRAATVWLLLSGASGAVAAGGVSSTGMAVSLTELTGWMTAVGCCRNSCWPLAKAEMPAGNDQGG
jgi:hypothetical protein